MDEIILQIKSLTDLNDLTSNNGFNAGTGTLSSGTLRAVKFSGLQRGLFIDSFDIKINTASGNIRAKIYGDSTNKPDQFLGESESITSILGNLNLRFLKMVEIPQDGIIWVAIENDNSSLDVDLSTGQTSGTLYSITHTYGSGPDPFGAGTAGTSPFWAKLHYDPKVVKHYGVRGSQPENFFCVVSTSEMRIEKKTTSGSNNIFKFYADLSYHGVDFQHGLKKVLDLSSSFYDLMHMTNLNGKVHNTTVEIEMEEISEGDNLYLIGARVFINCEALVLQI